MRDPKHEALAEHIGCEVADVENEFSYLLVDFHLEKAKRSEDGKIRRDADYLLSLAEMMDCAPGMDLTNTSEQVRQQAKAEGWVLRTFPANNGRNERARIIAYAVARVFVATGYAVGKGTAQVDGEPTSKYGRAVQKALNLYGIKDGWRGPAKDAAALVNNTN